MVMALDVWVFCQSTVTPCHSFLGFLMCLLLVPLGPIDLPNWLFGHVNSVILTRFNANF